jgi:hypothetical protein
MDLITCLIYSHGCRLHGKTYSKVIEKIYNEYQPLKSGNEWPAARGGALPAGEGGRGFFPPVAAAAPGAAGPELPRAGGLLPNSVLLKLLFPANYC